MVSTDSRPHMCPPGTLTPNVSLADQPLARQGSSLRWPLSRLKVDPYPRRSASVRDGNTPHTNNPYVWVTNKVARLSSTLLHFTILSELYHKHDDNKTSK